MLFVGVALLVAFGLALAISADVGALFGLSQGQTAQTILLVTLLVVLASSIFVRRQKFGTIVASLAVWIGLGAIMVTGYAYRLELTRIGTRVMGELQPGAAVVDPSSGNVRITRSFGGSFRVDADINGATTPMIFDTGASAVVLSTKDAEKAGISTGSLNYSVPVQTANGTGRAAPVTIKEMRIGNITRRDIHAFVVTDSALDTSLLGMTFLETLSRYTVSQDALEMHD